jgi:transcription termination/antitermination protein NusA
MKKMAVRDFTSIDGISAELAQSLIDHGYFTFDDLSIIDPDTLSQLGGVDMQAVDAIIEQAEIKVDQMDT